MKLWRISISVKWAAISMAGLLVMAVMVCLACPAKPDIPAQQVIDQALTDTAGQESYEYEIQMKTIIDGKEELVSDIAGQRQDNNRIHIKGRIFESDVDFYQIGSTTYTKDRLTDEWVKITDSQLNQQDIFMQELNPLAGFAYKELNQAEFSGTETIDGRRLWVYTARPVIDNEYMGLLWKDFGYKFWLDPRSLLIYNARITAIGKSNPANKLNLEVKFRNYNGDIRIEAPDTGKS